MMTTWTTPAVHHPNAFVRKMQILVQELGKYFQSVDWDWSWELATDEKSSCLVPYVIIYDVSLKGGCGIHRVDFNRAWRWDVGILINELSDETIPSYVEGLAFKWKLGA